MFFLCYQTKARALGEAFDAVTPPPALQVSADYGSLILATAADRHGAAVSFMASLLGSAGQATLKEHGFEAAG